MAWKRPAPIRGSAFLRRHANREEKAASAGKKAARKAARKSAGSVPAVVTPPGPPEKRTTATAKPARARFGLSRPCRDQASDREAGYQGTGSGTEGERGQGAQAQLNSKGFMTATLPAYSHRGGGSREVAGFRGLRRRPSVDRTLLRLPQARPPAHCHVLARAGGSRDLDPVSESRLSYHCTISCCPASSGGGGRVPHTSVCGTATSLVSVSTGQAFRACRVLAARHLRGTSPSTTNTRPAAASAGW